MNGQGARKTLLIVEDEPAIRRFLVSALGRLYRTLEAADGHEALRVAQGAGHIDVLVTDIVMPGMDGVALANALASADPELRVLFISGFAPGRDVLQRFSGAHRSFLGKPFALASLLNAVEQLVGERRSVRLRAPRAGANLAIRLPRRS